MEQHPNLSCMNGVCSNATLQNQQWLKGWPLQNAPGFATLCHKCGTAYQELIFCETFHSEDTGWRDCTSCGKRLHCGCIASTSSFVLLDTGGVNCIECANLSKLPPTPSQEKLTPRGLSTENGISQKVDKVISSQTDDEAEKSCEKQWPQFHGVANSTIPAKPPAGDFSAIGEMGHEMTMNLHRSSVAPSKNDGTLRGCMVGKDVHESLVQTNLSIGLSVSSASTPFSMCITKEKESTCAFSPTQPNFRPQHLLPKISNSVLAAGLETTKSRTISPARVARPPVEGRIKNQLLPRYWPRITDQELQQISGDSNSTIVPLFEKVLSASDAGRIGRLVLPKACAEAYFPPISQPEGLPLKIQDVKGKEWLFQFRFWPNNNSRMYVLEGVTPCIQSMQLQAGDTVTFSRMDPEGKLLMGFRKASLNVPVQDSSTNSGAFSGDPFLAAAENIHVMNGYSGLFQSLKGNRNSSMSLFQKHVYPGNISPQINEKNVYRPGENQLAQSFHLPERKRSRNIGPKSKRLLMDGDDAMDLKLSWDELQDLLRSPLTVEPSTTDIEDHEFEEFEEPPVFGKRSIFIVRLSGEQEQWAQCDSCFKWRKVPFNLLVPPRWTCQEYSKDQMRSSCSAPDELNAQELEKLLKMNKEFKRRRLETSLKLMHAQEHQEVEVSETATAVGGDTSEPGSSSAATTTKHPRHRPGCSCIVCIQPPSGKGKHKPTCTCNVCMTVKRRFKTLMMRKQKRQSEREAETAQRNQLIPPAAAKEEAEVDSVTDQISTPQIDRSDNTRSESELNFISNGNKQQPQENSEVLSVKLDLNCCPGREAHAAPVRNSMMSLVQEASLPLETYLRQNGLASLVSEQQATSSNAMPQEENQIPAVAQEDSGEYSGKDQGEDDDAS